MTMIKREPITAAFSRLAHAPLCTDARCICGIEAARFEVESSLAAAEVWIALLELQIAEFKAATPAADEEM